MNLKEITIQPINNVFCSRIEIENEHYFDDIQKISAVIEADKFGVNIYGVRCYDINGVRIIPEDMTNIKIQIRNSIKINSKL